MARIAGATRVLIVDDEPSILDLLTEMLSSEGMAVATAQDGEEALARIAEQPFDVIISDFRMPRMTGRELYNAACERTPGIGRRFVFISGEMDPVTKREFILETGVPVISKPFRAEVVKRVVRETLNAVEDGKDG